MVLAEGIRDEAGAGQRQGQDQQRQDEPGHREREEQQPVTGRGEARAGPARELSPGNRRGVLTRRARA